MKKILTITLALILNASAGLIGSQWEFKTDKDTALVSFENGGKFKVLKKKPHTAVVPKAWKKEKKNFTILFSNGKKTTFEINGENKISSKSNPYKYFATRTKNKGDSGLKKTSL